MIHLLYHKFFTLCYLKARYRNKWAVLVFFFLLIGCSDHRSNAYTVAVSSPNSERGIITSEILDKGLLVDIKSKTGIGSGTINLVQGNWPKTLLVRLHLRGLEGIKLTDKQNIIEPRSITTPKEAGVNRFYVVEYDLSPQEIGSELKIEWVDFYR